MRLTTEMPPRKRENPTPSVVLAIMRSTLGRWAEIGQKFSTLNTDSSGRMAIGIVLDNAYVCEKCSDWLVREKDHTENICPDCKKN